MILNKIMSWYLMKVIKQHDLNLLFFQPCAATQTLIWKHFQFSPSEKICCDFPPTKHFACASPFLGNPDSTWKAKAVGFCWTSTLVALHSAVLGPRGPPATLMAGGKQGASRKRNVGTCVGHWQTNERGRDGSRESRNLSGHCGERETGERWRSH